MNTLINKVAALSASSRVAGTTKDVFDDLVALAFNSLADGRLVADSGIYSGLHCAPEHVVELTKYAGDAKAWAQLQELLIDYLAVVKASAPFEDVLGEPYSAHVGQILGQFLTPSFLSTNAATLANSGADDASVVRLFDQCCGAGALLLGAMRDEYARHGQKGVGRLCVYASDLDIKMCRLASVQVALSSIVHELPVLVLHVQNIDAIKDAHLLGKDEGLVMNARRNI